MLVTGVILVLALVISFAQVSLNAKNRAYKVQEAELQKQIKQEIVRSEEIDELEEYVGTDKYIEDVAKDKLGLVYPNEILFEAEP
jgi:cell division protein DivIC